jgi:hypothetical protein
MAHRQRWEDSGIRHAKNSSLRADSSASIKPQRLQKAASSQSAHCPTQIFPEIIKPNRETHPLSRMSVNGLASII